MRIKNLNVGVEAVTFWQAEDEVHLPAEGRVTPAFLPQYRPLDEILRRPSLDERLPSLLQPAVLDTDLLDPSTLAAARLTARAILGEAATQADGARRSLFAKAAVQLDGAVSMDEEVRRSLAVLLRG